MAGLSKNEIYLEVFHIINIMVLLLMVKSYLSFYNTTDPSVILSISLYRYPLFETFGITVYGMLLAQYYLLIYLLFERSSHGYSDNGSIIPMEVLRYQNGDRFWLGSVSFVAKRMFRTFSLSYVYLIGLAYIIVGNNNWDVDLINVLLYLIKIGLLCLAIAQIEKFFHLLSNRSFGILFKLGCPAILLLLDIGLQETFMITYSGNYNDELFYGAISCIFLGLTWIMYKQYFKKRRGDIL